MERIDDLIKRLREVIPTSRRDADTIAMAIYELENGFNPADGVWIIKEQGRNLSKFAELSELETVDIKHLASLELLRNDVARAMSDAIEATRQTTPAGEPWWTYAPQDVIDKMFRIMVKNSKPTP